jgi:hypothetical protein
MRQRRFKVLNTNICETVSDDKLLKKEELSCYLFFSYARFRSSQFQITLFKNEWYSIYMKTTKNNERSLNEDKRLIDRTGSNNMQTRI